MQAVHIPGVPSGMPPTLEGSFVVTNSQQASDMLDITDLLSPPDEREQSLETQDLIHDLTLRHPALKRVLTGQTGTGYECKVRSVANLPLSEAWIVKMAENSVEGIEGFERIELEVPNVICRQFRDQGGLGLHDHLVVNYYFPLLKPGYSYAPKGQIDQHVPEANLYMSGFLGTRGLSEYPVTSGDKKTDLLAAHEQDFLLRCKTVPENAGISAYSSSSLNSRNQTQFDPYFVHISFPTFGGSKFLSKEILETFWDFGDSPEKGRYREGFNLIKAAEYLLDVGVASPVEAAKLYGQLQDILDIDGVTLGHSSAAEMMQYSNRNLRLSSQYLLEEVPRLMPVSDASNHEVTMNHWAATQFSILVASMIENSRLADDKQALSGVALRSVIKQIYQVVVNQLTGSTGESALQHSNEGMGVSESYHAVWSAFTRFNTEQERMRLLDYLANFGERELADVKVVDKFALLYAYLKARELGRSHTKNKEYPSFTDYGINFSFNMAGDRCVSVANAEQTQRSKILGVSETIAKPDPAYDSIGFLPILQAAQVELFTVNPWNAPAEREQRMELKLQQSLERIFIHNIGPENYPTLEGKNVGHNALIDEPEVKRVLSELRQQINLESDQIQENPQVLNFLNKIAWIIYLRSTEDRTSGTIFRPIRIQVTSADYLRENYNSDILQEATKFNENREKRNNLEVNLTPVQFNFVANAVAAIRRKKSEEGSLDGRVLSLRHEELDDYIYHSVRPRDNNDTEDAPLLNLLRELGYLRERIENGTTPLHQSSLSALILALERGRSNGRPIQTSERSLSVVSPIESDPLLESLGKVPSSVVLQYMYENFEQEYLQLDQLLKTRSIVLNPDDITAQYLLICMLAADLQYRGGSTSGSKVDLVLAELANRKLARIVGNQSDAQTRAFLDKITSEQASDGRIDQNKVENVDNATLNAEQESQVDLERRLLLNVFRENVHFIGDERVLEKVPVEVVKAFNLYFVRKALGQVSISALKDAADEEQQLYDREGKLIMHSSQFLYAVKLLQTELNSGEILEITPTNDNMVRYFYPMDEFLQNLPNAAQYTWLHTSNTSSPFLQIKYLLSLAHACPDLTWDDFILSEEQLRSGEFRVTPLYERTKKMIEEERVHDPYYSPDIPKLIEYLEAEAARTTSSNF